MSIFILYVWSLSSKDCCTLSETVSLWGLGAILFSPLSDLCPFLEFINHKVVCQFLYMSKISAESPAQQWDMSPVYHLRPLGFTIFCVSLPHPKFRKELPPVRRRGSNHLFLRDASTEGDSWVTNRPLLYGWDSSQGDESTHVARFITKVSHLFYIFGCLHLRVSLEFSSTGIVSFLESL